MLMVWQLIWEHFAKWLDTVAEILAEGTGGLRAVEALFRYIVSITPIAPPEVREALRQQLGPQLRQEGLEEGRAETTRRHIVQVLKARFPKSDWSDINGLLLGKDAILSDEIYAISLHATSARQFRPQLMEKLKGDSAL